jgi:hypothetical protein
MTGKILSSLLISIIVFIIILLQVIRFLYIKDGGGVFRFYFTTFNLMKFN